MANKRELSPSMSFSTNFDDTVHRIKAGINFGACQDISALELQLQNIMPLIKQTIKEVYSEINSIMKLNETGTMAALKNHFQVALILMEFSNEILEHTMRYNTLAYNQIPSLPINLAQVLYLTFEHCKTSQKTYQSTLRSVTEVLDLFRKTQEVHSKFLNFLDTYLVFNLENEIEVSALKDLLSIIVKLSEMLCGINTKSMADNWKGYMNLISKYSEQCTSECFDLSTPVRSIILEIDGSLQNIIELGPTDMKKPVQIVKVVGFLIKVALKLFETFLTKLEENLNEIINFCITIYSWNTNLFKAKQFHPDFIDAVNNVIYENTNSFVEQLLHEEIFINKLCYFNESKHFGFINFTNDFLKILPQILENESEIVRDEHIVSILNLLLNSTKNCYTEFFFHYFYEEIVTNFAITVLLMPQIYPKVELLLLHLILDEFVWTSILAMDIWWEILRYTNVSTCRSIFNDLLSKLVELNLGIFIQTPNVIFLKVFIQRIFQLLPSAVINEEISKYNPSHNLSVWKILNLKHIPLSQRFHIEFVLNDLLEKFSIFDRENCQLDDILSLMENIDIVSGIEFNNLEINVARLVPFVLRLWSYNANELSTNNHFYKYFVHKLIKLSKSVLHELNSEHLILILNQLKVLLDQSLFKLLTCDILQIMSKMRLRNNSERLSLLSLISDIFQLLLLDKNSAIIQLAVEAFKEFSTAADNNYESVVRKVSSLSLVRKNIIKCGDNNDIKDLDKFRHKCLEWTNVDQPQCKKIKVVDIDDIINNLKNDTQHLIKVISRNQSMNLKQITDVKGVIYQLEMLL